MASDSNKPVLTMDACLFHKSAIKSLSKWKDVTLVLMHDSTLGWYRHSRRLSDCIRLSTVCKYMCVGHTAKVFPKVPKLPKDADFNQILGVPVMNVPRPDKMYWFCFDHVKHLIKFLQTLDSLLPRPDPKEAEAAAAAAAAATGATQLLNCTSQSDRSKSANETTQLQQRSNHDTSMPSNVAYAIATNENPYLDNLDDRLHGAHLTDAKKHALLKAGGVLAAGVLLGRSDYSWGYGWGNTGPLFQDIEERELIGYIVPSGWAGGAAAVAAIASHRDRRYNRAYQRYNSDLCNDLDRSEEERDRRESRRSDLRDDSDEVNRYGEMGVGHQQYDSEVVNPGVGALIGAAGVLGIGGDSSADDHEPGSHFHVPCMQHAGVYENFNDEDVSEVTAMSGLGAIGYSRADGEEEEEGGASLEATAEEEFDGLRINGEENDSVGEAAAMLQLLDEEEQRDNNDDGDDDDDNDAAAMAAGRPESRGEEEEEEVEYGRGNDDDCYGNDDYQHRDNDDNEEACFGYDDDDRNEEYGRSDDFDCDDRHSEGNDYDAFNYGDGDDDFGRDQDGYGDDY